MAPFFTSGECNAGWRFAYAGLRMATVPGGASLTPAYTLWDLVTPGPASLRRRAFHVGLSEAVIRTHREITRLAKHIGTAVHVGFVGFIEQVIQVCLH